MPAHSSSHSTPARSALQNHSSRSHEDSLVARVARGDRAALRELYEIYLPRLTRFFTNLTASNRRSAIEPLIFETLYEVWQRSCAVGAGSAHVWIMGLAFRHASRFVQARGARPAGHEKPPQEAQEPCTGLALLEELSLQERATVHLVYTGHARDEIAGMIEVTAHEVDALLTRARLHMARILPRDIGNKQQAHRVSTGNTTRSAHDRR